MAGFVEYSTVIFGGVNGLVEKTLLSVIKRSTLMTSSAVYLITNVLSAIMPIVLMFVLTRYLNPSDYGKIAMFQVITMFLSPIITLNLHGIVSVKYFQNNAALPAFVFICLIIVSLMTLVVGGVLTIFGDTIAQLTRFPVEWLWVVMVLCLLQFFPLVLLVIHQSAKRPFAYGIMQTTQIVLDLTLTLFFVIGLDYSWQGRVIGQFIATAIMAGVSVSILYNKKYLIINTCKKYFLETLKFGIPLIPHAIAAAVIVMVDRVFITNMLDIYETGVYAVGAQVGMAIGLVTNSVNQAYVPWLYEKLQADTLEGKKAVIDFSYKYMFSLIVIAGLFSLVIVHIFPLLFNESYREAATIVLPIAFGYALNGMYKLVANYFFYCETTYILALITSSSALLHIPTIYFGILFFGLNGAAYAVAVTQSIAFIATWKMGSILYPMPWKNVLIDILNKIITRFRNILEWCT